MRNADSLPPNYIVNHRVDVQNARMGNKSTGKSMSMVAGLTCLQLLFAIYATILLYYMQPPPDLSLDSGTLWPRSIAMRWRGLLSGNHNVTKMDSLSRYLAETTNTLGAAAAAAGRVNATCVYEQIDFEQKVSDDPLMLSLKQDLYADIRAFQKTGETLPELLQLPSVYKKPPKITVILNHFKRRTLCAQLDALLNQTAPFHELWVLAFGSPHETLLRSIVLAYNDPRIFFVSSTFDFKYYGRFQLAIQTGHSDFVYILDDDIIPGRKMIQILVHIAGTEKYRNALLGSIGRILPFRQKDFSFPSYRKHGIREAGLYLPDPAYNIKVDRVTEVDFLSSSWFLPTDLVRTLFIETPFTFATGEDLHLSYQLQKYNGVNSYVVPVDVEDKDTWGDSDHRLAYIMETTIIHKEIVEMRDVQWWRAMSKGFVTQWAKMYPQRSDALFFAHSLREVVDLAPLILAFRNVPGRKAYLVVTGGSHCPCEEAVVMLGWPQQSCYERRFKIFDLEANSAGSHYSDAALFKTISTSMKGLLQIHSPRTIITVADLNPVVQNAITSAVAKFNATVMLQLPRSSILHSLWIANLNPDCFQGWKKMRISVNIITQNRAVSLLRLLRSLVNAYYLGDRVTLSFNMDSKVDSQTLKLVHGFVWPHGEKIVRRRIVQGGLIRAVSESWYPETDHDFGLLLEDDIEVSPYYYIWLKYTLLTYHYDPRVSLPELIAISLYTPRVIEVVKERPKWNATHFFLQPHPNTPYLHQLPCSWGSLFFPKPWREFYKYMGMRYTEDAKKNPVQIPHSRTNGWQASWKKFLIDLMYLRGYVSLYPNFPNQTSFSTNHMEPGVHINASDNTLSHRKEDFEVPLMSNDFRAMLPLQRLPSWRNLPVLNLFNQLTTLKGLKASGAKLGQDVLVCQPTQIVKVHPMTGEPLQCATF